MFGDPMAYTFADPDHSVSERGWLTFGMSALDRVLAVIYTERRGKVRLISAKEAGVTKEAGVKRGRGQVFLFATPDSF